ncbi:MAG: DMT family transporter [Anaerotignum sp.]|nr:DMT family transporter [Anaerotignum sp.]
MYYLLSILVGVIISVMVSLNGGLTASYGAYSAAVIIHIVGVIFAALICAIRKERLQIKSRAPQWAYFGGAIGVLTTLFNNYAYGRITMTSIVALGLLGQSLSSVVLDSFGWLGVEKRRASKSSVVGYLAAIIGIFIMMDNSVSEAAFAVVLSLSAGITVVLSRTINSRLSTETSPLVGSFLNHLVGLPICIVLALCLQRPVWLMATGTKPWMYLGGALGVVTVLLFNITVPRVSAFHLTLLSFIGQIFTGIALDLALGLECSTSTFAGGLVITAGLLANMMLEQWNNYRNRKRIVLDQHQNRRNSSL